MIWEKQINLLDRNLIAAGDGGRLPSLAGEGDRLEVDKDGDGARLPAGDRDCFPTSSF